MGTEFAGNHPPLITLAAIIRTFFTPPAVPAPTSAIVFRGIFIVPTMVPTVLTLPTMSFVVPGLLNFDVQRTTSRAGECLRADIMIICAPSFVVAFVVPGTILWAILSPLAHSRTLASVLSPIMTVPASPLIFTVSHHKVFSVGRRWKEFRSEG
jgi:hypothetical protein